MEEDLDMAIPDKDAEKLNSVEDVLEYIKTLGTIELGERERELIATITELMDSSGVNNPGNRGPWVVKAERLSYEQKLTLSRAVDALTHWLERRYWETPK
ncbi:MAG: hypothetical protein NT154_38550 [Verrucomicrobia bacterium]|nr:hypothetical protein [Verrucomicrobiota bacterium]